MHARPKAIWRKIKEFMENLRGSDLFQLRAAHLCKLAKPRLPLLMNEEFRRYKLRYSSLSEFRFPFAFHIGLPCSQIDVSEPPSLGEEAFTQTQ
jgi:hypothetical protein